MKNFVFISTEGYTYQPESDSPEPDSENMQVIGFGPGNTVCDAFGNLLDLHEYLVKTSFDEIFAIELKSNKRKYLSLKDSRKKYLRAR